ncbi:hypothetical protein TeGR_g6201, partial [Tetraparma gracilis]
RTAQDLLDEDFRVACGAYVKNRAKPGVRVKFDVAEAKELLDAGAGLNSVDGDAWTSLHWAAAEDYVPVLKFLLKQEGLELDRQDKSDCTALWTAAYNGIYSTAMLLLFAGASLTPQGSALGTRTCTAETAARSQRHSTVANVIGAEAELRRADPERQGRLRRGEVEEGDFRTEVKDTVAAKNSGRK